MFIHPVVQARREGGGRGREELPPPPPRGGGSKDSMSVEDTNAMRIKAGLKPLK